MPQRLGFGLGLGSGWVWADLQRVYLQGDAAIRGTLDSFAAIMVRLVF